MGLDLSPNSLTKQLLTEIGKRFPYFVVPFVGVPAPGILRFGDHIPPPRPTFQTTPFHSIPSLFYYFLNLIDISVGLHRLHLPPNAFTRIPGGTTIGLFIESGIPITRIAQHMNGVNAYGVVMRAFEEYYDSKHLHRTGPERSLSIILR
ncbi:hypothetical protein Dsin_005461 [Dipteronia sinensis]|nr:hypothetical protein Dsin_005461 [Dipteronia sinensis]